MPFWSRNKKPHPETIAALEKVRNELEKGKLSVESDTWRMMANEHVLSCILDDIKHDRLSLEDASAFQRYNEMAKSHKKEIVTSFERGYKDASMGECSETVVINTQIEKVWDSWRNMEIISQTILDGSAGRIDETHFWIRRVESDKGDIWLETFEEVELDRPTHVTNQKTKIEVQAIGMDASLQEVNLEGEWLDYIDFEEAPENKTKLIFHATFIPSRPMTDYGKVFLAMFTQTQFHPTMREEIQHQLKKFKEIVETQ